MSSAQSQEQPVDDQKTEEDKHPEIIRFGPDSDDPDSDDPASTPHPGPGFEF